MNDQLQRHEKFPLARRKWRRPLLAMASILLGAAIGVQTSGPAFAQSTAGEKPKSKIFKVPAKDQPVEAFGGYGGGAAIPEPILPAGADVFDLSLEETRLYSRSLNFEVVGHSYFKGPWLTPFARQHGLGAGFNTPRVYDGIAYLGGYNGPPTLFGVLIADVRNPLDMQPLSFVPCNPGTRCPYIRINTNKHIMVGTHDTSNNPIAAVGPAQAGVSFTDVSDPANPQPLGFLVTLPGGATHGMDIDDRYAYACATTPLSKTGVGANHELVIVDYADPRNPKLVSTVHIKGQRIGEDYDPQDGIKNDDGTLQQIWCHEIFYDKDTLYVAWRDAGMIVVDVTDRANPVIISRLDYVPPFQGQGFGAAHSSVPVLVDPKAYPKLVINSDELFQCPGGFVRVMDITNLAYPQVISSYRIPSVDDVFNFTTGKFVCPPGSHSSHLIWQDFRSASLMYTAWYTEGLRAVDYSNPFLPREVGYYFSPPYVCGEFTSGCGGGPPPVLRHTREVFQDKSTGLIYMTDGSGGGLTVLRWTGQIPRNPPIPGAR